MISDYNRKLAETSLDAACLFTLQELAEFAYAREIGGIEDERFSAVASHLEDCEKCQKHLSALYVTDPFLANKSRPRLGFLEKERRRAVVAGIAANQAMQPDDPEVGELARQSLRELLPDK